MYNQQQQNNQYNQQAAQLEWWPLVNTATGDLVGYQDQYGNQINVQQAYEMGVHQPQQQQNAPQNNIIRKQNISYNNNSYQNQQRKPMHAFSKGYNTPYSSPDATNDSTMGHGRYGGDVSDPIFDNNNIVGNGQEPVEVKEIITTPLEGNEFTPLTGPGLIANKEVIGSYHKYNINIKEGVSVEAREITVGVIDNGEVPNISEDYKPNNKLENTATGTYLELKAVGSKKDVISSKLINVSGVVMPVSIDSGEYMNLVKESTNLQTLGAALYNKIFAQTTVVDPVAIRYYDRINTYLAKKVTDVLQNTAGSPWYMTEFAQDIEEIAVSTTNLKDAALKTRILDSLGNLHKHLKESCISYLSATETTNEEESFDEVIDEKAGLKIGYIPETVVLIYINDKDIAGIIEDGVVDSAMAITKTSYSILYDALTTVYNMTKCSVGVDVRIITRNTTVEIYKNAMGNFTVKKC